MGKVIMLIAMIWVAGLGIAVAVGALLITQPLVQAPPKAPHLRALPRADPARLARHVATLCDELGPRDHLHTENLDEVARYVARSFSEAGGRVREQAYAEGTYRNVIGVWGPEDDHLPRIIVGAHYDTHGPLPGADDNASGVAALLEVARLLTQATDLRRPVELVAYTLEEFPHAMTPMMGSDVHARALRAQGTPVLVMMALEMVGFYRDSEGSQSYPTRWLQWLYPNRGDFLAVVGRWGEFRLMRRIKRAMRGAGELPIASINAPRWVEGVERSDHVNYWNRNYAAVMVTDTAFLRNPNYHTRFDTPDTLDYVRMAQAVTQVHAAVVHLANSR